VLDAHDNDLTSASFQVSVRPTVRAGELEERISLFGTYDARDNVIRIEDVPVGRALLGALSPLSDRVRDIPVDVRESETTPVVVRYEGPAFANRIVVQVVTERLDSLGPALEHVRLRGAKAPVKVAGAMRRFAFDDLAPGEYTVEIDDPQFQSFVQAHVRPGTFVRASLQGSASIALRVRAAGEEELVSDYRLGIAYPGSALYPREFPLREIGDPAPPGGVYRGIVPGVLELIVGSSDGRETRFALPELRPNEVRAVDVELPRATALREREIDR
jgi:hypothetical protein